MAKSQPTTMRPFKGLRSLAEVSEIIDNATTPIMGFEQIGITSALNRVLSEDIKGQIAIPPFDRSAMDGYIVKAKDTYGSTQFKPANLKCIGNIHAGAERHKVKITKGKCAQIATGAVVPGGADAVVMVEDTERAGNSVKIYEPVHPGQNISNKGEDIRKGEVILKEGSILKVSKIGVLAALGISKINVYNKPKIAIIPTGNEVAELAQPLKKGQVYDINSYTLYNLILENGGEPIKFNIVEDTYQELSSTLKMALKYDVIIFTGGSSVGEKDLLVNIIEDAGEVLFHGVQIKPGKPTLCGKVNGKLVFGLPGYPAACLTIGYLLIAPVLRKISNLPPKRHQIVRAKLSRRVVSSLGRHQFLTVSIKNDKAIPVFKESGAITSIANAVGYIEIPENVDLLEKGDEVEVKII
ncbi:MAG: molybdenum cofactor biosynthesis protein [Thermoplasmata archaeon]|nr:molybdenum cofactor biosynthesis protein [Thermoplasmata archaeon]